MGFYSNSLISKLISPSPIYPNDRAQVQKVHTSVLVKKNEKKNYSIFCAITVENIKTFYSPNWLKQKLLRIGIEPSNNVLDLKDFIRLETGYPFEIYDLDKIRLAINDKNFKLNQKSILSANV